MDEFDRQLINRLQHGLPLVRHPWEALAKELGSTSEALRERVQALLEDGTLTRFGPMFDIDRLGGAFTLAGVIRTRGALRRGRRATHGDARGCAQLSP